MVPGRLWSMNIMPREQGGGASPEDLLVRRVFDLGPSDITPIGGLDHTSLVAITTQFSRTNPRTSAHETISGSRVLAIPPVTERFRSLAHPTRGDLTAQEVTTAWRQNLPQNDGQRHPDRLFEIAVWNFGSDVPTRRVEQEIYRECDERERLRRLYTGTAAIALGRSDVDPERVEMFVETMLEKGPTLF
jgi:hypothetical protein